MATIFFMEVVLSDYNGKLRELGTRLRSERIKRQDTQAMFAARIGVSVPTLRKMESGDATVQIGNWAATLSILDRLEDIDALLSAQEDLFAKFDQLHAPQRQRVRKRT